MKITELRIRNFRSIKSLDLHLGERVVLIGPNNAGKSAVMDAIRIALTRRWGQRGTGFLEHDLHRTSDTDAPKSLPPVEITLVMDEPQTGAWDSDMVAALEDIMTLKADGRNRVSLRVTCSWNQEKEAFEPAWEFLNEDGDPLTGKATRAINLTGFFSYMPLYWLGALRDAANEFTPKAGHWGRLLKSVQIPKELEEEALATLLELDTRIGKADPKLGKIAEMIGKATHISIGDKPGSAKLNTLPTSIEEMVQRTGVILKNGEDRPWFPISHHGQGLQSLSVIFLFQAAVRQQLIEDDQPGAEPVFAIEEPETHLHPQAARTLWGHMSSIQGQLLMTTHSPYFVQNVPLRDLRLMRLVNGCSTVASPPPSITSSLPWTTGVDGLVRGAAGKVFMKDAATGNVAARTWFSSTIADQLEGCYRREPDFAAKAAEIKRLHHESRILPSDEDEEELGFHGRRVRGDIFFAQRWILVEGITEHLLLHALGKAFGWDLDAHGVAVVDFQNNGAPGIYAALGDGFGIPWNMVTDGDNEGVKFKEQILKRGFVEADLTGRLVSLPSPMDLEDALLANGHESLLRGILSTISDSTIKTCPLPEFTARLKNKKTDYMSILAKKVAIDPTLAEKMPAPFVTLVKSLRDGTI